MRTRKNGKSQKASKNQMQQKLRQAGQAGVCGVACESRHATVLMRHAHAVRTSRQNKAKCHSVLKAKHAQA